jgi:uncharacterized protein (TIRG00374 family)
VHSRKYGIGQVVGYLISALCIAILAFRIDWPLFIEYFRSANPFWLAAAVPFAIVTYVFFTLRWRLLLSFRPPLLFGKVFSFLMLGYSANSLFPMRAGDALRVALVRREYGQGVARAFSSILLERVFDLLTLLSFGALVALSGKLPEGIIDALWTVAILAALLIVLIVMIALHANTAAGMLQRLTRPLGERVGRELVFHLHQFADAIDAVFPRDRGSAIRLVAVVITSLLGWGSFGIAMIACTAAFGVEPAISAGLLMMVVTNLGSAIPSSPGSVGVYHALAVVALAAWSVQFDLALSVATTSHAIAVGIQLVLGLLAMVTLRRHNALPAALPPSDTTP